jgi:hypothetical protein
MAEAEIRDYARDRRLRAATVERWLGHAPADRAAVLAVTRELRLGENQLCDVFDALEDIAVRRDCSIASILDGDVVKAALGRDLGRSDRIKMLKACLRRLRYPQLSAAEDRVAELTRELGLPGGTRLEVPEFLEGDAVTVTLRAKSAADLRAKASRLAEAVAQPQCEEIFAILEGAE